MWLITERVDSGRSSFWGPRQQVVMSEHNTRLTELGTSLCTYSLTSAVWSASPSSGRADNVRRLP